MVEATPPNVHLIAIGAELLSADRLETNSHEIQAQLMENGFRVGRCVVVDDRVEEITRVIRTASEEADFIITTGGLGPTEDDVTREAAAKAAGVPLEENAEALADIEQFFRVRNRDFSASNRRQALIPKGATLLRNPIGTAPSFRVKVNAATLFCLPGVPSEMRELIKKEVLPCMLQGRDPSLSRTVIATVHLCGLTESSANDQIRDILQAKDPRAGITVHSSVITLKLTSRSPDAESLVEKTKRRLYDIFGDIIFGEGDDNRIENATGRLLIDKGISFATAESCTGGLIGHLLTSVPGISQVFMEGAITYSGDVKARTLGVPQEMMESHGQVSREVAEAMALGIAKRAGTRAGLGITGIAGPTGGTPEKPVGRVHMAAALDGRATAKEYTFSGNRDQIKARSARLALNLLRRVILDAE